MVFTDLLLMPPNHRPFSSLIRTYRHTDPTLSRLGINHYFPDHFVFNCRFFFMSIILAFSHFDVNAFLELIFINRFQRSRTNEINRLREVWLEEEIGHRQVINRHFVLNS